MKTEKEIKEKLTELENTSFSFDGISLLLPLGEIEAAKSVLRWVLKKPISST